jgi:NADH-quinone oxidoreductase subunit G
VESNFLLRQLVGADNFAPGFSDSEQSLVTRALQLQQATPAVIPDLPSVESADAVLVLGEDVTNTAPRIALALRQSVRNRAYAMAADLRLEPWMDAAIRNLAQDARSPLYIASVGDTPLDDAATGCDRLAPQDIAHLGEAVAAHLRGQTMDIYSEALRERAAAIGTALSGAERPLVVSGTGAGSGEVMDSAAAVVHALGDAGKQAMLCLVVPEANSLGQALLCGPGAPDLQALRSRAAAGEIDTLVVLENDLYRRGPRAQIDALLTSVKRVVVLDGLDNDTVSKAALALPAASFAEAEGTLVSLEGRAQRHFPVFPPGAERRPAWVWLLACLKELDRGDVHALHHFDDVTRACATTVTALAGITAAAPDHDYRNVGVKIPRMPHRYSGRTAMRADVSVHEPKQPEDEESALAFTMEGLNRAQPGSLLPYVWSPGWNSNQSLHKFQSEVGGSLRGGTAGVRLLQPGGNNAPPGEQPDKTFEPVSGSWQLVPRQKIFGSEELSALSPGIEELVNPGFLELRSEDAAALGVADGDGIEVGDTGVRLEARVNDSIAPGCAGFSAGHAGSEELAALQVVSLKRAENWQRRQAQLIASDNARVAGHD